MRAGVASIMAALTMTLMIGCGDSGSAPFGGACVTTSPANVAPGANQSLYVQVPSGILHYSKSGKLLARFGPRNTSIDFTVDPSGNAYYPMGAQIVKVSGSGATLAHFRAPGYQPEAVDSHGVIIAVQGGSLAASDETATVARFSPSGRMLSRWRTAYASRLAMGADGFIYANGGLHAGGDLVKLEPSTGKVLKTFFRGLGDSFDALTADPRGAVYVGVTNGGDAPFAVQRVSQAKGRYTFTTINTAQDQVGGLAVGRDGSIFVIRASYDEPGGGSSLEELSPSGDSMGKFAYCKP